MLLAVSSGTNEHTPLRQINVSALVSTSMIEFKTKMMTTNKKP